MPRRAPRGVGRRPPRRPHHRRRQRHASAPRRRRRRRRRRRAGAGKPRTAPDSATKSEKPQWRVPATPMSPLKRNASAGDAGGMGMLLDALAQVGGMPPPSPLHLRSPPHGALRRQSYLSTGAMAAASPSMRPAAAAMSALCASAPPSADRADATTGGVGGVAPPPPPPPRTITRKVWRRRRPARTRNISCSSFSPRRRTAPSPPPGFQSPPRPISTAARRSRRCWNARTANARRRSRRRRR